MSIYIVSTENYICIYNFPYNFYWENIYVYIIVHIYIHIYSLLNLYPFKKRTQGLPHTHICHQATFREFLYVNVYVSTSVHVSCAFTWGLCFCLICLFVHPAQVCLFYFILFYLCLLWQACLFCNEIQQEKMWIYAVGEVWESGRN